MATMKRKSPKRPKKPSSFTSSMDHSSTKGKINHQSYLNTVDVREQKKRMKSFFSRVFNP